MKNFVKETVHRSYVSALAFGIFIGSISILLVLLFFGFGKFDNVWVVLNSSSLIGTGATLFAVYWAWHAVQNQIEQSKLEANELKRSKLRAARSALPITISSMVFISRSMIQSFFDCSTYHEIYLEKGGAISAAQIETIKECIEFADDITSERLAHIIRLSQLLNARFDDGYFSAPVAQGDVSWTIASHSQISYLVLWAAYDDLLNSFFSFSRGTEDVVPETVDPNSIYGVFAINCIEREDYPRLFEILDGRVKSGSLDYKFH